MGKLNMRGSKKGHDVGKRLTGLFQRKDYEGRKEYDLWGCQFLGSETEQKVTNKVSLSLAQATQFILMFLIYHSKR